MSEPFQNLLLKEWRYERLNIKVKLETTCPSSNIFPALETPSELLALGIEFPPSSSRDLHIAINEMVREYLEETKVVSIKGKERRLEHQ